MCLSPAFIVPANTTVTQVHSDLTTVERVTRHAVAVYPQQIVKANHERIAFVAKFDGQWVTFGIDRASIV